MSSSPCIWSAANTDRGTLRQAHALPLSRLDQFKQQLLRQDFRLHRTNLLALATPASGHGEDLSCHPVGCLVCFAIKLASDRVTGWRLCVHEGIMDDMLHARQQFDDDGFAADYLYEARFRQHQTISGKAPPKKSVQPPGRTD